MYGDICHYTIKGVGLRLVVGCVHVCTVCVYVSAHSRELGIGGRLGIILSNIYLVLHSTLVLSCVGYFIRLISFSHSIITVFYE